MGPSQRQLAETPLSADAADAFHASQEALKNIKAVKSLAKNLPANMDDIRDEPDGWDEKGLPDVIAGHKADVHIVDCAAFFAEYIQDDVHEKLLTLMENIDDEQQACVMEGMMPLLRFFEHACDTVAEYAPSLKLEDPTTVKIEKATLCAGDICDTFEAFRQLQGWAASHGAWAVGGLRIDQSLDMEADIDAEATELIKFDESDACGAEAERARQEREASKARRRQKRLEKKEARANDRGEVRLWDPS